MLACRAMSPLAASLLLALSAAGATQAVEPLGEPSAELREASLADRIVAVVDEDPILWSDIERTIELGLIERQVDEDDATFVRRVLDRLVEMKLRFHEIDRFGFEDLPLAEVDRQMEAIRERFADREAYRAKLAELGLTPEEVREILARRLVVTSFVEQRLGPRVFVSLDDIRRYYERTLVPEMERRGEEAPELSAVRESIRRVLREQRLNEEIAEWTEELRLEADVVVYLDRERDELPPVVDSSGRGTP
ncbi:MAG: hypothetical protein R3244_05755 [Thermoanaerobaculia bacterium]|nr:hypothetical protein [Thermoanaerobaculia bacterium]